MHQVILTIVHSHINTKKNKNVGEPHTIMEDSGQESYPYPSSDQPARNIPSAVVKASSSIPASIIVAATP